MELKLRKDFPIIYILSFHLIFLFFFSPSGLESTSLMLAYGMDLFYTRVTPSGTFDILRDDFDWEFISIVMILLIVMSYVVKRYWRITAIRQAWS